MRSSSNVVVRVFTFACFATAMATVSFSQANVYSVVGVSDGDTITVLNEQKKQAVVRLAGIDAPEKGQDFGNRAKQQLSSMIFGKNVHLNGDKIDRYGRRVAKVMIDGTDANLEMIKVGLAGITNNMSMNKAFPTARYMMQPSKRQEKCSMEYGHALAAGSVGLPCRSCNT